MIPAVLTQRIDRLQELETAKKLLATIQASETDAEAETQFLSEKINALQSELNSSAAEAQKLIDLLGFDMPAKVYAGIRYQCGYSWAEIADMFKVTEDAAKSRVYRCFAKITL